MKRIFLLIIAVFAFSKSAFALDIVYPKTNPVKIGANSTFFIGSTNPTDILKINDMVVNLSPQGAFAQVVPLQIGQNIFKITSKNQEKTDSIEFIIERPKIQAGTWVAPVLIEYPPMGDFFVKNEGTPLRTTPVDGGINRMSHLKTDTQLTVTGEKSGFYRVYLNSKLQGWVSKQDVEQRVTKDKFNLVQPLRDFKHDEDKEFSIFEFSFDKAPIYSLKEDECGLNLEIYNVSVENEKFKHIESCFCDNTLNLIFPAPQKLFGYEVFYEEGKLSVKVRKFPKIKCEHPLKGIVITLDPGHGGAEYGAIGPFKDREKDINLLISKNLQKELEQRGAKVVMTRIDDSAVSLKDRVKIAKENNSSILISVHANALPDGGDPIKCRGTSVYYYHPQAKPLAQSILSSMTTKLQMPDDKVRQGSLALVRSTQSVSVLVEVGYMINPDDSALLLNPEFQLNCAKAIADGVEDYLRN